MPLATVYASAPASHEAHALLSRLSSLLARELGKPEAYVMTCLAPAPAMTFAGSSEPCCVVEIKSVGGVSARASKQLSEAVCMLVEETLNVPRARTYVVSAEVPAHLWGTRGGHLRLSH